MAGYPRLAVVDNIGTRLKTTLWDSLALDLSPSHPGAIVRELWAGVSFAMLSSADCAPAAGWTLGQFGRRMAPLILSTIPLPTPAIQTLEGIGSLNSAQRECRS